MVPVSCNDDGGEFGRSICEIYPKDFELRLNIRAIILRFWIWIQPLRKETCTCKLFDKRDSYSFLVVRIPHIANNITQNSFYSAVKVEVLRTVHSTLCLRNFTPKAKEFLKHMEAKVTQQVLL